MIFSSALRRLTVIYSAIQLALMAALAIGVYAFVAGTFDFDAVTRDGAVAVGAVDRGFALLRTALLAGFAMLCVIVPFTSYWMARFALGPLKQSYHREQQFVDNASHELRGPLSVISGELELALTRERSSTEYRRAISASLEATRAMVTLADDLLLLARGADGRAESRLQLVSGDVVVSAALTNLPTASRIRLKVESYAPAELHGSLVLLARALSNIIDNALKYSAAESTVNVTATISHGAILFTVEDDGPGMTPDQVHHAFDRFWRGSETRAVPGHGLGLALVKAISEAHHGQVTIDSSAGRGTTVTLTLPTTHAQKKGTMP